MCRLFASISHEDVDLPFRRRALEAFFDLSREHKDGWGMGRWIDGNPEVVKEPVAAYASPRVREESARSVGPVLIAHVRWASIGKNTMENTHPFAHGDWIFGHNGTLDFKAKLRAKLRNELLGKMQGDTDSEVLFLWLMQSIAEHDDEEKAVLEAMREAYRLKGTGTTALNFVMSDGARLFALNAPFTRFDHYGMHYLVRDGERDLMVSSQPLLDDRGWRRLPRDHLLVVDREIEPRFIKI